MKHFKEVNTYVADLSVFFVKVLNLHWNTVGRNFFSLHKFLDDMYNEVLELADETAEVIRMRGENPAASMQVFLDLANIKEIESVNHGRETIIKELDQDMRFLIQEITKIRGLADESGDFTLVSVLEDHAKYFEKELWMIDALGLE